MPFCAFGRAFERRSFVRSSFRPMHACMHACVHACVHDATRLVMVAITRGMTCAGDPSLGGGTANPDVRRLQGATAGAVAGPSRGGGKGAGKGKRAGGKGVGGKKRRAKAGTRALQCVLFFPSSSFRSFVRSNAVPERSNRPTD